MASIRPAADTGLPEEPNPALNPQAHALRDAGRSAAEVALMQSIEEASLREDQELTLRFQHMFADWLQALSEWQRPAPDDDAAAYAQRTEKLESCTRTLMTTSATKPWMIWDKITVLEHFLHGDGGESGAWTDNRLVWLLACIKADMMRHSFAEGSQ